jgi:hypothetical protein
MPVYLITYAKTMRRTIPVEASNASEAIKAADDILTVEPENGIAIDKVWKLKDFEEVANGKINKRKT